VLLLQDASQLEGAGFTCTTTPAGEVISQYEWYVVNPTTFRTDVRGDVLGDPEVFLQSTIYSATSSETFTSATLPIVAQGYKAAVSLDDDAC
jgi:hypothetical protein